VFKAMPAYPGSYSLISWEYASVSPITAFLLTAFHFGFQDALAHLLRHWNLDWEKACSESLAP
jgi:hypothetical protein